MDHKNLTYFWQPHNLNHQQAQWLLNLSEFDLTFKHIPGRSLCAPDALSHRPDHIPPHDTDNEAVTLLPDSLFVNLIDTSLSAKLHSSSASNPLILDALHTLPSKVPVKFHSHLSDWCYDAGILTYQDCIYVPADADFHHSIIAHHHNHPTASHPGVLKTCQLVASEFWWPGLASFVCSYVCGCASCQQNKANIHPSWNFPFPPLDLINNKEHYEIEKILHHKGTLPHRQYLIHWTGYSAEEDSWLPEMEFSSTKELLQDYKNSLHRP